jgi:hypothetical protein
LRPRSIVSLSVCPSPHFNPQSIGAIDCVAIVGRSVDPLERVLGKGLVELVVHFSGPTASSLDWYLS